MPTGTGRGGRGGGRGRSGGSGGGNSNDDRVKVGVAWINGQPDGADYLADMNTDGVYLRFSLDDFGQIPEGWNIFGFPNKNKVGKAPDIDFVALPPKNA